MAQYSSWSVVGYFTPLTTVGYSVGRLFNWPSTNMGPKMGVGPPLGGILNKFSNFLSSSSSSMYRGLTIRIWAISANFSCLQDICCHFCQNLSPGAALGYLRNGALAQKTFLVKVGWYEVYKTHIEFGAIPWDEGAKFGILLELVCLKYARL